MRPLIIALAASCLLSAETPPPPHITFARVNPQPGQLSLFIAAADGSDEHPLLASADTDYDAVWSPDGASIVFTSERNGSADLFRVRTDGSGLTRLTSDPAYDDQAGFSPDSKQLVFVSSRGGGRANLWTMNLATQGVRRLTSGAGSDYRPSWAPNGKWIAFASSRANPMPFSHGRWERLQIADIYIIHPDGSGLKKLTEGGNFCGSPKWTSDSNRVISYCMDAEATLGNRTLTSGTVSGTKLVSIEVASGLSTEVSAGPGLKVNPSPLPGNDVGYVRKDTAEAGIYYTSGRRGPRGAIRAASWSPDATHVVFHRRANMPRPSGGTKSTFSYNPRYTLSLSGILPAYSSSGKEFLTSTPPSENPTGASLNVTTVETGATRAVYQDKNRNVLAGAWSPLNERIVFSIGTFAAFFGGFRTLFLKPADRAEDGAQIAIVNADGTGFQEITSGKDNNAFPTFAPDGKRLVYRTFSKDECGLRQMDLETKAVTKLTSEYDNFPLWSPRGDLILFSRLIEGAYEIFTIRPDGTSLKRLTSTHGNDAHEAWSPDGEYIVFASSRMGFKDEAMYTDAPQPYGEIFVMRYDGSGVEQLTDNQWEDGTPAWQPPPRGATSFR